jgi:hypothetical protein
MPVLNTLHKGSHTQMRKCFRVSHICWDNPPMSPIFEPTEMI